MKTRDDEAEERAGAGSNVPEAVEAKAAVEAADVSAVDDEDFYMDGEFLVFTAAFHLKRGYCCKSDCRHCPYRES